MSSSSWNPRQRTDGKIVVIDRPLQNTQLAATF